MYAMHYVRPCDKSYTIADRYLVTLRDLSYILSSTSEYNPWLFIFQIAVLQVLSDTNHPSTI